MSECLFCNLTQAPLLTTEYCVAFKDQYPVTDGHTLIIPKQHRKDFFELTSKERNDIFDCLNVLKLKLEAEDSTITGFNIGMNCGESSGQTIFHCHIHLIPRRNGDCERPMGGVRGVIPGKQYYEKS